MSIKILTTADLHLGKTSSSADTIGEHGTTRNTWLKLVDYAIENDCRIIVIAGDIVEQENRYFEAVSALEKGLDKLKKHDVSIVLISGNHDYNVLPQIIEGRGYDHVHLLGKEGKWDTCVLDFEGLEVQFVGWSFTGRTYRKDPLENFDNTIIKSDLTTIGLVHGEYGLEESNYAPLSLSSLVDANIDAWVMGHIHKPEIFQNSNPLIYYPGSPHALSSKEPGVHGPFVLKVSEYGIDDCNQIDFSPTRYEKFVIDVSDVQNIENELERVLVEAQENFITNKIEYADTLELLVLDVIFSGKTHDLHQIDEFILRDEYKDMIREIDGIKSSIRTIKNQCELKVKDLEKLSKENSPAGLAAQALIDLENNTDSEFLERIREEINSSIRNLNTYGTYIPLRNSDTINQISENSEELNELLKHELNSFLSELLKTKETAVRA